MRRALLALFLAAAGVAALPGTVSAANCGLAFRHWVCTKNQARVTWDKF